jgi:para-aminobenzoate synthetase/4-amino-4-deoxychorismate lyase
MTDAVADSTSDPAYRLGPLTPTLDRAQFGAAFDRIKQYLADGDSYQVNFTFKMMGAFAGDAFALFADLTRAQEGTHGVFLHLGRRSICSASPELFFSLAGATIAARPMKGTSKRGRTLAEDLALGEGLRTSAKQQAENVMVVDMVRNDLGRIAEIGTVAVPELFAIERYPNLWQMTSLVTARSLAPLADVFVALHPSASVTGAPKVRTTEIVNELEPRPRGIYTGAIGHIRPDGDASFNVAIRTAVIDHNAGTVEFGIGSGIVWDSDASAEYDECLLKGSVLGRRTPVFELLETLRWSPQGDFFLLERHLARLSDSAEYFGFSIDLDRVRSALAAEAGGDRPVRVRLLLSRDGTVRVERHPLTTTVEPLTLTLASDPVSRDEVFLFHKTTNRVVYDRARVEGFDEVVLWNTDRQVTEALTANIVALVGGRKVTPPIDCGLLGGTYRAELLARGDVVEAVISVDDLQQTPALWLINSVHESRRALLTS